MEYKQIEQIINNILSHDITGNTKCSRGQHGSENPRQETINKNPPWIQGQDPTITHTTNEYGNKIISYKYENVGENEDTQVEVIFDDIYEIDYPINKVIITDKDGNRQTLEYMGRPNHNPKINANEFFKQHKDTILEKYGQEGWDFFVKYSSLFATSDGFHLNSYLRGIGSKDDIDSDFIKNNYNRFLDMEKSLNLSMDKPYVTLRVFSKLHDNDDSDKRIVSDKAHTSATVGADMEDLFIFANTEDIGSCYRCLTVVPTGRNVPGAYFGTAMEESITKTNWEVETNFAPDNKFKRLFVDEKNKIIVQEALGI